MTARAAAPPITPAGINGFSRSRVQTVSVRVVGKKVPPLDSNDVGRPVAGLTSWITVSPLATVALELLGAPTTVRTCSAPGARASVGVGVEVGVGVGVGGASPLASINVRLPSGATAAKSSVVGAVPRCWSSESSGLKRSVFTPAATATARSVSGRKMVVVSLPWSTCSGASSASSRARSGEPNAAVSASGKTSSDSPDERADTTASSSAASAASAFSDGSGCSASSVASITSDADASDADTSSEHPASPSIARGADDDSGFHSASVETTNFALEGRFSRSRCRHHVARATRAGS